MNNWCEQHKFTDEALVLYNRPESIGCPLCAALQKIEELESDCLENRKERVTLCFEELFASLSYAEKDVREAARKLGVCRADNRGIDTGTNVGSTLSTLEYDFKSIRASAHDLQETLIYEFEVETMVKYEYTKRHIIAKSEEDLVKELNATGQEGWEVAATLTWSECDEEKVYATTVLLKRRSFDTPINGLPEKE